MTCKNVFLEQICYFDRLQRSNIQTPRRIPLTTVWKKEIIETRMKIEQKRGFGKGVVRDRLKQHIEEKDSEKPKQNEEHILGETSSNSTNEMKVHITIAEILG